MRFRLAAALLLLSSVALAQEPTPRHQLARDIFRELIGINTTESSGSTMESAQAMAARLKTAGYTDADIQIVSPGPRKANLIARLRGAGGGGKPILLLAHMDVVEARREDWSFDPFTLLEKDGYFYGRGTDDNKAGAAMLVANMMRWKQEGYQPARDIILLLTTDEETEMANGIGFVVAKHHDLIDAEFCLNTDGGGGELVDGKYVKFVAQTAEKVYLSFRLEARHAGGHSSVPTRDNPIYHLARALGRIDAFAFPPMLNETTRAYFARSAQLAQGRAAADMRAVSGPKPAPAAIARLSRNPVNNARLRTTCVATMLEGGHAENALPQLARALVNCRILPGHSPDDVEAALKRVVADDRINFSRINEPVPSPPSPLTPEVMGPVEKMVEKHFPGAVVVPSMSTGATDGLHLRRAGIPTYGVAAIFTDPNENRAHGRDERVPVKSFYESVDYWYDLVKELAGSK
jgi:acetylornithine deacetylase/succinyl-diaminopimelate desuccinylase-like protein